VVADVDVWITPEGESLKNESVMAMIKLRRLCLAEGGEIAKAYMACEVTWGRVGEAMNVEVRDG
jgi:hypothetical protein